MHYSTDTFLFSTPTFWCVCALRGACVCALCGACVGVVWCMCVCVVWCMCVCCVVHVCVRCMCVRCVVHVCVRCVVHVCVRCVVHVCVRCVVHVCVCCVVHVCVRCVVHVCVLCKHVGVVHISWEWDGKIGVTHASTTPINTEVMTSWDCLQNWSFYQSITSNACICSVCVCAHAHMCVLVCVWWNECILMSLQVLWALTRWGAINNLLLSFLLTQDHSTNNIQFCPEQSNTGMLSLWAAMETPAFDPLCPESTTLCLHLIAIHISKSNFWGLLLLNYCFSFKSVQISLKWQNNQRTLCGC